MKNIYRPCPICESISIENIKRITINMDGLMPDFYFLAKCNDCGFMYANTCATLQDYEKYYEENNRYSSLPTQEVSSIKTYDEVSNLIGKYFNKEDNILDIGCGTGDILKLMKLDGYKYLTGLDPAQSNIEKLAEGDIYGIRGTIYDIPSSDMHEKFNAIILSGVLEHLYDLKCTMNNLKLYIKNGGKILCIVPNALEYCLYPSPLPHYINIEHINHFTPNSITRLFYDNGFSLLECVSTVINFGSMPDPALLVVFEHTDITDITLNNIKTMFLNNDLKQKRLDGIIDKLVSSGNIVAIFGTGNFARTLMANTSLNNANIVCFLDNDLSMHDKSFCGYKVYPPSFLEEPKFDGEILILSMHAYSEIEKQLEMMGFADKIINY